MSTPREELIRAFEAAGRPPRKPAARPVRFRISIRPFRRAYGCRPQPDLVRDWSFRLLDADREPVYRHGAIVFRGPYRIAIGQVRGAAHHYGAAIVEVQA